ncbi:MAG: 2-C-methyl-D-erythritol 4-phosphate cytidylyltransferase [Clostridiales bacterium]|nr:2-C-methyl-D-erythritol 4-phosphate cytidylyltransferase [Clostridiales bacterium]
MNSYAIVLGGGSGKRMAAGCNKVFLPLRGVPAIARAIAPFSGLCAGCVVAAVPDEVEPMRELLARCGLDRFVIGVVPGGKERQDSVWNGLQALPQDADCVLIHDGARALVTEDVIQRAIASVRQRGSGVAAVPVVDTIKRADGDGRALETLDRSCLYAMQTPQAFRVEDIVQAHLLARRQGYLATDDAALLEHAGLPVYLSEGSRENIKLTTPVDLALADVILQNRLKEAQA